MLMRRRSIAAFTTLIAATTVVALLAPVSAHAGPKPRPSSPSSPSQLTLNAPYPGAATFHGTTWGCDATTVCQLTGSADAVTGDSTVEARYQRSQPISSSGGLYGRARQEVSYSVPPGARSVTAVLTYRVSSASAVAATAAGSVNASAALVAWFADSCVAPECQATTDARSVVSTYGPYGLPGPPQRVTEPYTESLTVTATGTLPPTLLLQTHAVASAGGGGEYGPYCLHWDGCTGPSVEAHAGVADATIDTTLQSIQFSAN